MLFPACRGGSRFGRTASPRRACRALIVGVSLLLAACDNGSTTGGGTANSRFVGTYDGVTTAAVSSATRAASVSASLTVFVHNDGLVQIGDAQSTIFASGFLRGSRVRIDADAAALVDGSCSGTITLAGTFEASDGGVEFTGEWSSAGAACFGTAGTIDGQVTASRVSTHARATRVLETSSPALRRAFRQAAE